MRERRLAWLAGFAVVVAVLASAPALAKRLAGPEVQPIVSQGRKYEIVVRRTPCAAEPSPATPASPGIQVGVKGPNWETEIYRRAYLCGLETDVQDVLVHELRKEGGKLIVIDERGLRYDVDAVTGKLLMPSKAVTYAKASAPQ
jgi:hypothetical protein